MFILFSLFYFQDFGWFLLSLLWILFQVDCLFPLHLLGQVVFYLAPSAAAYSSVFPFCLTYCFWGLLFSGCKFVIPIVFWCLSPVFKFGSVACVGFLVEGTGACVLVSWILSVWWAGLRLVVCFGVSVNLIWFQAVSLLMVGVVLLSCSLFAWGFQHWSLLAVGWSWVLVLRWRSLGELSLIDIMWGWDVSGGLISWTQLSHLRGSCLKPGQSTKILLATQLRIKGRKKERKIDK